MCFDAVMEIAEEGFSGAIPLVNAKAEVSASHPERSDYEETVEFSYITKAELDALPDERTATVAGSQLTLSKLDVKADRVPSDPGTEIYSGQAVYGVHEQRDVADEYRLTATYAGEVTRDASPGTVVAVYEPVASAEASAAVQEGGPGVQHDADAGAQSPVWIIVASFAIAVCAAAILLTAGFMRKERGRDAPASDEECGDVRGAGEAVAAAYEERGEDADCED